MVINMMRYPSRVTVEVTTVCNVIPPCVMCAKHTDHRSGWINRDASHFPKELIPKIKNLLAACESLSLYGIGEPLTSPYFFDFKQYVSPTCHTQFTTNGWLLTPVNNDKLIDHQLALMDISLDATSPDRYAKIRHGDFEETVEKIARFIRRRNERGSIFPGVVLNMCLMRENIDDLPGLPALMKRTGVNHCYAFHLNTGMAWKYDWFDYDQQHCALDAEHHDAVVRETFAKAQELGVSFEFKGVANFKRGFVPPSFTVNLPSPNLKLVPSAAPANVACGLPWDQVIVYRDGSIANCCWQGGFMGNLNQNTFEEIWEGAIQQAVRDELRNGKFHSSCMGPLVCPPRGRP